MVPRVKNTEKSEADSFNRKLGDLDLRTEISEVSKYNTRYFKTLIYAMLGSF